MAATTGLRATDSSSRTSSLPSQDKASINQPDENTVVKRCALECLGHAYDPEQDPAGRLKEIYIKDLSINSVGIRNSCSTDLVALAENAEDVVKELKKGLILGFNLNFPSFSLGAATNLQTSNRSTHTSRKIIFATMHIRQAYCILNQTPTLNKERDQLKYAHLVYAGWVYTGYKILFEITIDSDEEAKETNTQIGGNAGVKAWGLGASVSILTNKLRNKKIIDIQAHCDVFGNHTFPSFPALEDADLAGINKLIEKMRANFIENIYNISLRPFIVDEQNLLKCAQAASSKPQNLIPDLPPLSSELEETILDFAKLGDDIYTYMDETSRQTFDDTLISGGKNPLIFNKMLESIYTVFSNIYKNNWHQKPRPHGSYTMVMGTTGAGKSTLIGYRLGGDLQLQFLKGKYIAVYKQANEFFPELGHDTNSKTKGFEIWSHYVDTAGLFDTDGYEEQLCNAKAMEMATSTFSPQRLIVVLGSDSFRTHKSLGFINLIKNLKTVVRNVTSEEVMSSVLFLVNDMATGLVMNPICKDQILNIVEQLKNDKLINYRNELNRYRRLIDKTCDMVRRPNLDLESLTAIRESVESRIPVQAINRLNELRDEIQILSLVNKDNLIVANCTTDATRKDIETWETNCGSLSSSSFTMEDLIYGGAKQFAKIIGVTIKYFNNLFSNKEALDISLSEVKTSFDSNRKILQRWLDIYTAESFEERKKATTEQIANLKSNQKDSEQKIITLNSTIEKTKTDIVILESETSIKQIEITRPLDKKGESTDIKKRKWWQGAGLAQNYKFRFHDSNITILDVKEYAAEFPPKELRKKMGPAVLGEFRRIKNEKHCYESHYLPGWWNNPNDEIRGKVKVIIFYKPIENQSSQSKIEALKALITDKTKEKKELEKSIKNDQDKIDNLEKALPEIERNLDLEKQAENSRKELEKLNQRWNEMSKEFLEIQQTLNTYHEYCLLLCKLVKSFKLLDTADDKSEGQDYVKFFSNLNIK